MRFGAREIPRQRFLSDLQNALEKPTMKGVWRLEPGLHAAAAADSPVVSGGAGASGQWKRG